MKAPTSIPGKYALVLVLACAALSQAGAQAQTRSFPPTQDGIFVFYDQLPGWLSAAQWQFAANNYAGCQKMVLSDVHELRSYNPDFIVLHYQLALGQGEWSFIDGNDWVQDWDDALPAFRSYAGAGSVSDQNDWFVTWGGERVWFPGWGWYIMDITFSGSSPATGYPDYWLAACTTKMRTTECDGVFADSYTIDSYFGQVDSGHPWFNDIGSCSANWVPALEEYSAYIMSDFAAQPESFYFLPNLGQLVTGWDPTDYSSLGHGGMCEGFGKWGPSSPFDLSDWQLQMDRLLSLANAGKILLLECDAGNGDLAERMFFTGCYLLVKGETTYITLSGANVDIEWFPEYEIDLGAYTGGIPPNVASLYDAGWSVYRRDYANGFVLVNPTGSSRSIPDLGGTFRRVSASGGGAVPSDGVPTGSLSYTDVTSLTLPAYSAAVLLNPEDLDSDGDGLTDSEENALGTDPGSADSDDDGYSDIIEVRCDSAATALDPLLAPRAIRVNFQPSSAGTPPGYCPDGGGDFAATGYGWR